MLFDIRSTNLHSVLNTECISNYRSDGKSELVLIQHMINPLQIDPETGKRMYNGYQLVRATPESEEHLDILRFIEKGRKTRIEL